MANLSNVKEYLNKKKKPEEGEDYLDKILSQDSMQELGFRTKPGEGVLAPKEDPMLKRSQASDLFDRVSSKIKDSQEDEKPSELFDIVGKEIKKSQEPDPKKSLQT